jgi:outer membrane protein assembly factor BamD
MVYLRNRLADYEVEVAQFYLKREAYVGAANRARGVIESYDGAPAVDDALRVLSQAYRRLGVDDLAQVADNVRKGNAAPDQIPGQPDPSSAKSKKDDDPWWRFWN